jgi:catechol 2,3-dioxygenase-like lactoylglutathione lyase family enzyme
VAQSEGDGRASRNRDVKWRNNGIATRGKWLHDSGMAQLSKLGKHDIVGFISIVDVPRAKEFYRDTLGLTLLFEEPPFALVFDAHGIMLRLGMAKELPPAHGTVLGWNVPDITAAVKELAEAGVRFERFPPMKQDELGIWTSPTGAKVAWFKDPDGNILSISEHPELRKI